MVNREGISKFVSEILEKLGIDTSQSINISDVLRKLDIELKYDESLPYDGKIEKKSDDDSVCITIKSSSNNEARNRFTIAHELGHYFLHARGKENFTDSVFYRNLDYNDEEFEANEFAACLLMPEKQFREEVEKNVEESEVKIEPIAQRFGVSLQATINRGRFLNVFE
ncbi:ImmA/IrrE family metallo-endopeptidase [Tetragenococcus halophilus]|uniref:ImmA/IrrE family metallo-endopeptidase n=1 Tax=Tetragenococcus halophilus TaxID=51669 RepID=UPI00209B0818|nr:ImmA/IrrE family metallo-endopeptidase [Tetragenococcus halophilus]MCO8287257.1 ImmA/IrrE family metallo-endopeptidase [Tetragenococcus halophilus]